MVGADRLGTTQSVVLACCSTTRLDHWHYRANNGVAGRRCGYSHGGVARGSDPAGLGATEGSQASGSDGRLGAESALLHPAVSRPGNGRAKPEE
jgi:hypothetical protein